MPESESEGEKTEAPTPRRRQEAREQGNVAQSPDLTAAVMMLGILFLLDWYGQGIIAALRSVVQEMLSQRSLSDLSIAALGGQCMRMVALAAIAVAPVLVGAMLIAILANLAQVGFNLNPARVVPNIAALNPVKGFSKVFGRGQGVTQLAINILKVVLVATVAYWAVAGRLNQIISIQQLNFLQIFGVGASIVYGVSLRLGVVLLVLALVDYALQRWRLERDLRMTKEEVKEEMRRMEGDPRTKQRRRQIAITNHKRRLKKDVPSADVVITNPTHFAVALKYDADSMRARVVAKGQDFIAAYIRELAVEAGVPIVERPPLARAIYKMCDVGEEIPEQFYAALAEILAYVYQLAGKTVVLAAANSR